MSLRKFSKSYSDHFPMKRNIVAEFNPNEQIFIKNPAAVKDKIQEMKKDGISKLNLLSDFDYTLTRGTINKEKADNSYKAIENVIYNYLLRKLIWEESSLKDAMKQEINIIRWKWTQR